MDGIGMNHKFQTKSDLILHYFGTLRHTPSTIGYKKFIVFIWKFLDKNYKIIEMLIR